MVMPPPMNQNSQVDKGLSSKKYCLMLKGRMRLYIAAFTWRQNIWKWLNDLRKVSKSADLIPETGIYISGGFLFFLRAVGAFSGKEDVTKKMGHHRV